MWRCFVKKQGGSNLVMKLESVVKSYKPRNKIIKVLTDIEVEFYSNNFYAIKGHSGSGKSTLINILGLIDTFDSGKYELYGMNVSNLNDHKLSNMRMKNIGFVFQAFHLNPTLKAYENVMVPMLINKDIKPKDRKKKAYKIIRKYRITRSN